MGQTVALPGMVVPPVDLLTGAVEPYPGEYDDVRVPARIGRFCDDEREVHPLGDWQSGVGSRCTGVGAEGRARHLFDVLHTHGGQSYAEDMTALPVEFAMVLTCIRCGLVLSMSGQANSDEDGGERRVGVVDPVPLQAGELLAQQTSRRYIFGDEYQEHWLVYREGVRVGFIATARGARGRRYVHGRVCDDGPLLEGSTVLAVLRRLARQEQHAVVAR